MLGQYVFSGKAWIVVRGIQMNQKQDTDWIKKLAIETARDVAYLLDRCPDPSPGQTGGPVPHPTASERASELRTTLREARKSLGLNPDPDSGETL